MAVGAFIKAATFSDGTRLSFRENDILIIVGPNNAGKSAALASLAELFHNQGSRRAVVTVVERSTKGSIDELLSWLEKTSYVHPNPGNPQFVLQSRSIDASRAKYAWQNHVNSGLSDLATFFCRHLTTSERLKTVDPPGAISLTSSAPQHPIHYLQRDDSIEKRVSTYFRQAFGTDVIIHHNSGSDVPLYLGERPPLLPGEDRVSARYLRELEKLPKLHVQGDGMRSFCGVLLHAIIGHHTIVLIDEPEAFLHPPQARLLGRMLATETPGDRQLFIATHSADVLQGLLDANKGNVRVVRLAREGNVNHVRELQTADVVQLWSDPLLRHSNILNGLFHEKVIVCESDADSRFYAAILETIFDDALLQRRDIMFVHCGGKGRIPTVVRALRAAGVSVCAVADFDVLNDENPLHPIYDSLGGLWDQIEADWRTVRAAIESKKPELSAGEVRKEIETVLSNVKDGSFPKASSQQIQAILRRSSPWATAKTVGKAFVPSGDPHTAYHRLIEKLAKQGLFVVEVGESEGFARSVGGHGPQWVNGVLPKLVARDPELNLAREFVKRLLQ
jgi:predicted ATPase